MYAIRSYYDPNVYATVGIHPHDAAQASPQGLRQLAHLAGHEKVVGYGEIGLDYVKNYAPRQVQMNAFDQQLHLAQDLNLPA